MNHLDPEPYVPPWPDVVVNLIRAFFKGLVLLWLGLWDAFAGGMEL